MLGISAKNFPTAIVRGSHCRGDYWKSGKRRVRVSTTAISGLFGFGKFHDVSSSPSATSPIFKNSFSVSTYLAIEMPSGWINLEAVTDAQLFDNEKPAFSLGLTRTQRLYGFIGW